MNKEEQLKGEPAADWHVYIVCCKDNSYYTGITTDLLRRIDEHNSLKKGARYTRSRRPVELAYFEKAASRAVAARREHQIKKLTPACKKQLIKTYKPPKPAQSIKADVLSSCPINSDQE
jgi:putative endonuclease